MKEYERMRVHLMRTENKMSYKEINRITGKNYQFISRWSHRTNFKNKKRRKSNYKVTEIIKEKIKEYAYNKWADEGGSLRAISGKLKSEGVGVSYSTVKRVLDKEPWGKPRRYIKSMKLSEINKKNRYEVAKILKKRGFKNDEEENCYQDQSYLQMRSPYI